MAFGKVQHCTMSAGPENTEYFVKCFRDIRRVTESIASSDHVKPVVFETGMAHIPENKTEVGESRICFR